MGDPHPIGELFTGLLPWQRGVAEALFACDSLDAEKVALCPSCGFTGRQATTYRKGELWSYCHDAWHDGPNKAAEACEVPGCGRPARTSQRQRSGDTLRLCGEAHVATDEGYPDA